MKTKKWLFELQTGEVFTIMPNVTDIRRHFIALGSVDNVSKVGLRPCIVFNDEKTRFGFANVQVYSCGLVVTKL